MFVEPKNSKGWIEVICGSMFSGKTEELIRRVKRAKIARQQVRIFKPKMETRYDKVKVVSHDDNYIDSFPVDTASEILNWIEGVDVVAIDEAQFFDDEIIHVCNDLANKGVRVIVAGLDMDFKGNPFGPMPSLMATAEYVTKVHAVCTRTGNLAQYSYRKSKNDNLVLLGEVEEYEPLSRAAFYKAMMRDKVRNMKVNDAEEVTSKPKNTDA
jgi:thymidine kinase